METNMNAEQWAYEEGQKAALRSLGIKKEDLSDEDISSMDDQLATDQDDMLNNAQFLLDDDEFSDVKKKFDELEEQIFNMSDDKGATELLKAANDLYDQNDKAGLTTSNSKEMDRLKKLIDRVQEIIKQYADLSKFSQQLTSAGQEWMDIAKKL